MEIDMNGPFNDPVLDAAFAWFMQNRLILSIALPLMFFFSTVISARKKQLALRRRIEANNDVLNQKFNKGGLVLSLNFPPESHAYAVIQSCSDSQTRITCLFSTHDPIVVDDICKVCIDTHGNFFIKPQTTS
jgi:hypothetical protein